MRRFCVVAKCSGEPQHIVTSSKVDVEFAACTYHVAGVSVYVGKVHGGRVIVAMIMSFKRGRSLQPSIGGTATQHELAS